jgi:hypothetical protein
MVVSQEGLPRTRLPQSKQAPLTALPDSRIPDTEPEQT